MAHYQKLVLAFSIILLFLVIVCPIFVSAASKSYSIDQIKIEAEILPDGSLLINESRSYNFRGSFRWADYSLPLRNLGSVTDFMLIENEMPYRPGSNEDPGTYQYSQSDEKFYVKWFYQAKNERRTFTLRYRVKDAVRVYNDVAELYYKFVSEKNEKTIGAVETLVQFPYPADTSQVRAWAHGPLHGQLAFQGGNVSLWVSPLPRKSWWEVRTIFPPEWVPEARKLSDEMKREQIMGEERLLVEQSNVQRLKLHEKQTFQQQHKKDVFQAGAILAMIGLAAIAVLFSQFGKSFDVPFQSKFSSEIPLDVSPAVANYVFYSGQIGSGAMVSTMLDLARRGFLKIEETAQEKKSIFGTSHQTKYTLKLIPEFFEKNKNELAAHEQDMIQFIFQNLAAGNHEIQLDEIKDSRGQVTKWFGNWKKLIKNEWGNKPFFDRSSVKGTIISVVISLLIFAAGIAMVIKFGSAGVIPLLAGFVLFGLSFIILRYTKEVKLLKMKLSALKQYLSKYHFKRDLGNLQTSIEKFLVYGIALGIGKKAMNELLSTIPEWQSGSYFAWYAGSMGHGSSSSLANAVSSMVSAASTTMGSAAGVGGGAAVGAGAGAGGASGGAG